VLFLAYMPIISSSLQVLDCTPPIAGVRYLRTNLNVPCGVGEHLAATVLAYGVLLGLGLGFPAVLAWILSTASADAIAQPNFQAAWGFLIGGYRTADLEAERIAAIAAALADAHASGGTEQLVAEAVAASPRTPRGSIAMMTNPMAARAMGKPNGALLAAAATLSRATPRASIHAGMMQQPKHVPAAGKDAPAAAAAPAAGTGGSSRGLRLRWHDAVIERYCNWKPERLLWWEALVMVRKAGIVLLAVLVTNPYFQCAGAAILLGVSMLLHTQYHPYSEQLFNLLEGIALGSAALTAVVTATLLQYDVDSPAYASQPPADMTRTQWAVTIALGFLNIATLALLGAAYVYLQLRSARQQLRVLKLIRRPSAAPSKPAAAAGSNAGGLGFTATDDDDGGSGGGAGVLSAGVPNPLFSSPRARAAGATPARRRSRVNLDLDVGGGGDGGGEELPGAADADEAAPRPTLRGTSSRLTQALARTANPDADDDDAAAARSRSSKRLGGGPKPAGTEDGRGGNAGRPRTRLSFAHSRAPTAPGLKLAQLASRNPAFAGGDGVARKTTEEGEGDDGEE
jgi:hypothetical protein